MRTNAYRPGRALDRLQAALGRRPGDPAAPAAVRDLRLRARGGGHPPARRQDRPRRPALVGPHGLPHRGLRAHARADDQERGHRARRRQGRLLPAPAPRRPGRAEGRGRARLRQLHQRPARPHRQPRRRRGRAPRRRARPRRRRHLPGRRRRQGHGDVLRHRQRVAGALRLLAGRRVRLRRLEGLRPQGAGHHRARRVGVAQAPLPRARHGPGGRRVHRGRHRRHVRRRLRQRDAAERQDPARRRLRPPPRLHRPRPRRRRKGFAERKRLFELAGSLVGRLRPRRDLRGRRRVAAQRQAHRAARAGARGARHRRTPCSRPTRSSGRSCARRSTCCGTAASAPSSRRRPRPTPTRWTAPATPSASTPPSCAAASWPRAATSASPSARGSSSRASGGLRQRRLHRQLRRRRLLRPRGQPQDPARPRGAPRRARRRRARRAAGRGHRGRRRPRALRLVPAGADARAGGARLGGAHVRLRGPHGGAGGRGPAATARSSSCPRSEEMAERRRVGPRPGAPGAGRAARLRQAQPHRRAAASPSLPDDPYFEGDLRGYFPPAVVERLGHLLGEHPLRRELVATIVANDVVNALGPTFVSRLVAEQGAEPADVVRAYRIARDVTGAEERWAAIERLAGVDRQAQWKLHGRRRRRSSRPPRAGTWRTRHGADLGTTIATGPRGLRAAGGDPARAAQRERARRASARRAELVEHGVPEELARAHAYQPALAHAPDIIAAAQARRALGRGRRAHLLRARRTACDRVDRGAARRAAGEHAHAALGAAGAARRPLARAARPRPARAGGGARRAGAGRGRARSSTPARTRMAPPRRPGAHDGGGGRRRPRRPHAWPSGSCARSRAESRARAAGGRARRSRGRSARRAARRRTAPRARASRPAPARRREPWRARRAVARLATSTSSTLRRPAQGDPRLPAAAVLERVGQALLHEPEGGQVDAGRQRPGLALDAERRPRGRRRASARRARRGGRATAAGSGRRPGRRGAGSPAGGASR